LNMQKAVSIVVVQGKKAFLGTRLNPFDNYGKRCFPGGKVENGESCLEKTISTLWVWNTLRMRSGFEKSATQNTLRSLTPLLSSPSSWAS